MPRPTPHLVIDARPRGPRGPLAVELVLGRPVLAHLLDLALSIDEEPVVIHARLEDHGRLHRVVADRPPGRFLFATGPPPEGAFLLRTDRLYDSSRLRRAVKRGRDPESAVLWRLDQPHALNGADDELTRRRSYQPLGRFWALEPARGLARSLRATFVRPNALTVASAALVATASACVAFLGAGWQARLATAGALAVALVFDTADGHLARIQGTASEFGRWLDAVLDECGDMMLHAAIAWAAYLRSGHPGWLAAGMAYAMGKYVFMVTTSAAPANENAAPSAIPVEEKHSGPITMLVRLAGHADVRWHLWIVLAALGRLELALAAYAVYFPLRALAAAVRRGLRHG
jgi:phosphatidylglycerophosphate synthase